MAGKHGEGRSRPFRLAVLMGEARAWLAWMRIEAEREKFDSHGAKIDLPVEKRFRRIFVIGGNIDWSAGNSRGPLSAAKTRSTDSRIWASKGSRLTTQVWRTLAVTSPLTRAPGETALTW